MKKSIRIFYGVLVVGLGSLCGPTPSTQANWTPEKYIVTIKKFELKNNTGQWVTVIEPDLQVDLLRRDPSLSYVNDGKRIPPGNYINFRITLSEEITVEGDEQGHFTKLGGHERFGGACQNLESYHEMLAEYTLNDFEEIIPTYTTKAEEKGPIKVKFDFDFSDSDDEMTIYRKRDFAEPLYVKRGSFIHAWFMLDLEDTLSVAEPATLGNDQPKNIAMIGYLPKKVLEMVLTVDKAKMTVASDQVRMDL